MVELLSAGLSERGHTVFTATTAAEGQRLIGLSDFDAIVLDIGLPDRSGYTIVSELKERPRRPAIIMLTALNQEDYIVCGLDAGADDYLTKPFSFPELAARITSAVRRTRTAAVDGHFFGPFELDVRKRRLVHHGVEVQITRSEYHLLRTLVMNRGEVVPRRKLMQAVWGSGTASHGALDTLVNTLREKLNVGQPGIISTLRGVGYLLGEETDLHEKRAHD